MTRYPSDPEGIPEDDNRLDSFDRSDELYEERRDESDRQEDERKRLARDPNSSLAQLFDCLKP